MPRVKKSVTAKTKHKKVLSATKGHYGARSRLYKTQNNLICTSQYVRDRKNKKESLGFMDIKNKCSSRGLEFILS